ncbi:MAG: S41 family peptidase [Bacillota bacterium]|nr:S41 family peptidase [Bacillota bacterium]
MKNRILRLCVLAIMITVWPISSVCAASAADMNGEYLQEVMDYVETQYNFDINDEELTQGAVKGMFDSLDAYSEFFTQEEADQFLETIGGNFEGVGVMISKVENYVVVTRVLPSTPAERAGVLAGDKIVLVDDHNVVDASSDEVASRIRGEKETTVTLGVLRNGSQGIVKIDIVRDVIRINPVHYEIKGDIAYLAIDSFNANTYRYVYEALNEIDEAGIKKVILDLRYNTGGEVRQAVLVARHFVPEGIITHLEFKNEANDDITYQSYLEETQYELVLLVNELTASASEILAGAIQDSGAGVLVGTQTFGKARVQNVVPLLTAEAAQRYKKETGELIIDGNELLRSYRIVPQKQDIAGWADITTGIYTTPNGRFIDGKGLTPDIEVADHGLVEDIFINNIVKLSKTEKPGLNSEGIDIYNAEKILRISGYEVDDPDMKMDARTVQALQKFQADQGLYPYGIMDFTTQNALNTQLDQLLLEYDKQYAKAVELLN